MPVKSQFKDRLYELLVENASEFAIFFSDPNGIIIDWNPGAERMFGYSSAEAVGQPGAMMGMALILAANANGGNVPAELRGPLFEMVERLSAGAEYDIRAKHFEMAFTGSLRDVKDVSGTVLAREKEPMQRPDGQWVRLYVLADASSRYIAAPTRDGFAAREQELWPGQFRR